MLSSQGQTEKDRGPHLAHRPNLLSPNTDESMRHTYFLKGKEVRISQQSVVFGSDAESGNSKEGKMPQVEMGMAT